MLTVSRLLVASTTSTSTPSTLRPTPASLTRQPQLEHQADARPLGASSTAGRRELYWKHRGPRRLWSTNWRAVWRQPGSTSTCGRASCRRSRRSLSSWNKATVKYWPRAWSTSHSRRLCRSVQSSLARIGSSWVWRMAWHRWGSVATAGLCSCQRTTAARIHGYPPTHGSDWWTPTVSQPGWSGLCRKSPARQTHGSDTASTPNLWRRRAPPNSTPAPSHGVAAGPRRYRVTWPKVKNAATKLWSRRFPAWNRDVVTPSTSTRGRSWRRRRQKRKNF